MENPTNMDENWGYPHDLGNHLSIKMPSRGDPICSQKLSGRWLTSPNMVNSG